MDIASILAVIVAFGAVLGGQAMEGGHASSILAGPAAMIVLGGTLGCVLMAFPLKDILGAVKAVKLVFGNPKLPDSHALVQEIMKMAQTARRDGLLALEKTLDGIQNPFMKNAVRQVVDGIDGAVLREMLEAEIHHEEQELTVKAKVWESAGGFCPTVGIIGAVLGLIHVMENLDDPSKIGGGIATAFVATVYGVAAANVFFLPMATKIKRKIVKIIAVQELIMEGVLGVQAGHNSYVIEARLKVYLEHGAHAKDASGKAAAGKLAEAK